MICLGLSSAYTAVNYSQFGNSTQYTAVNYLVLSVQLTLQLTQLYGELTYHIVYVDYVKEAWWLRWVPNHRVQVSAGKPSTRRVLKP
jgi:hypothetical protein